MLCCEESHKNVVILGACGLTASVGGLVVVVVESFVLQLPNQFFMAIQSFSSLHVFMRKFL